MFSTVEIINKYYVDRGAVVHASNSVYPKIISRLLGRNYDPLTVFRAALTSDQKFEKNEMKNLCISVGQELKINPKMISKLFKMIKGAQGNEKGEEHLLKFAKTYSEDSKNLKFLQQIKFDKDSSEYKFMNSLIENTSVISKWNALNLGDGLAFEQLIELDQRVNCPENLSEEISYLQTDKSFLFDDVKFLVKTNLIYSIIGMQNSTIAGVFEHEIKKNNYGLMIKKQGEWISVKKLRDELVWNYLEDELESKENSLERWNYFHDGLVPIDRYFNHVNANKENFPEQNILIQPVLKLSKQEMSDLLIRAKQFNGPNIDKSQELDCIIQLVANPRQDNADNLKKNISFQSCGHCYIRLIFSDGTVYSTGLGLIYEENFIKDRTMNFLQSVNGQTMTMDYEEFRPHIGRIVTNLPVSEKRAKAILNLLNEYRLRTVRFNVLKQNCAVLSNQILNVVTGIKLNLQIPFSVWVYRSLPDLKRIPVLGKFLKWSKCKISVINNIIPEVVKTIFSALGKIIFFIPLKLGTLLTNILVWYLAGNVGSKLMEVKFKNNPNVWPEELGTLSPMCDHTFKTLLNGCFDTEASKIQHSTIFVNWQLAQNSTDVHEYTGQPNLNILPPKSEHALKYSEMRKAEFKKMYKWSTPIDSPIINKS